MAAALLALAMLVGGAAAGNGKGHRGGHGNTNNGQTGYHFQVLDQSGSDRLLIQGSGTFNAHKAHGGGTYDDFIAGTGPPATFGSIGTGTWRATDVVSWTPGLTHGVYQGGTLVMHATFYPVGKAPIPNVTITVYCNLGPAGFSTGHAEGADVTVPGSPQLMFTQTSPTTGITIFTVPKRDVDVR